MIQRSFRIRRFRSMKPKCHGTYIGMEYGPCVEAGILANQRVVENMFQDIVLNGTSVEDAAAAANKQLNELFEAAE